MNIKNKILCMIFFARFYFVNDRLCLNSKKGTSLIKIFPYRDQLFLQEHHLVGQDKFSVDPCPLQSVLQLFIICCWIIKNRHKLCHIMYVNCFYYKRFQHIKKPNLVQMKISCHISTTRFAQNKNRLDCITL